MKTLPSDAPDVRVADCRDVVGLLADTINQTRKGAIDPRIANAIGYLASVLVRALENGELETRIKELESLVKARGEPSAHDTNQPT